MTLTDSIKTGLKSLKDGNFTLCSRLCEFERQAKQSDPRFKPQDVQNMSADDFSGIFTKEESDAIIFILAETGGDLDSVDRFVCYEL